MINVGDRVGVVADYARYPFRGNHIGKESTVIDIGWHGNKVGFVLHNVANGFFFEHDEIKLLT